MIESMVKVCLRGKGNGRAAVNGKRGFYGLVKIKRRRARATLSVHSSASLSLSLSLSRGRYFVSCRVTLLLTGPRAGRIRERERGLNAAVGNFYRVAETLIDTRFAFISATFPRTVER